MKKTLLLLSVTALLSISMLTGCTKEKTSTVGQGSLKLEDGTLSWDAAKNASSYEVDLGSGGETVTKNSYALADRCEYTGDFTVTVRALDASGAKTDVGTMKISAKALSKPSIDIGGTEEEPCFVWKAIEGANTYSYNTYDGKGIRVAEADKDGKVSVPVDNLQEQRITVTAHGGSKGNTLWTSQSATRIYTSSERFDMKLLGKYPAVHTGNPNATPPIYLHVGSTLTKGVYDLDVTLYVMDADGRRLQGNSTWARWIKDLKRQHFWFVDEAVKNHEAESENTIPAPNVPVTKNMRLSVNRGGNVLIPIYGFNTGEKLVVADIKYNGVSVLNASKGKPNPMKQVEKFDVSKADDYLVSYKATGEYYEGNEEKCDIEVPVNLPDGTHYVKVHYYTCKEDGDILEGCGLWGRRLAAKEYYKNGPYTWLNEYDLDVKYPGLDMPNPTERQTAKFTVEVKNKKFKLAAIDFNAGERVIIESVQTFENIPSGNGVHISKGGSEKFKIQTTLAGKPRYGYVTLNITYKIRDVYGDSVTGNGEWGRRIVTEKNEHLWYCETAVSDHYPESANTLVTADQTITNDFFFYEINKYGVISLDLFNFNPGEMIEVLSIKYNGQEVMVK